MSQGYKGGWGHFAKSFMDGYVEDRKEEERKENDLFKIKAQRWLNEETSFNSAKSKDKALVEQAKAIVASETLAPKGSEFTIYQGLKAGKSVDSIISDIRRSGADAWENFIPKPPENTGGIVPVEEQMDDLLVVKFFNVIDYDCFSTVSVDIKQIQCKALCVKCSLFGEHVTLATPIFISGESK